MVLRVALIGLLMMLVASGARAEKRVALVIGNSAYAKYRILPNPARDAAAIQKLFQAMGFDVVQAKRDLGKADMSKALRDFSDQVYGTDIAVVFYAGHGIEVNGTNYLVPVDAALERDTDVEDEAISLDRVTRYLEQAKRLRLVILDACRDDPFTRSMKRSLGTRSIGGGLAKVENLASDTLIAYAAKAGSTAADGEETNSPYTTALVKHLATPGLDVQMALRRVRDEVLASTARKQEPFLYGSLGGSEISLVPAAKPAAVSRAEVEVAQICQAIASHPSIAVVQSQLETYKGTPMEACAQARLDELKRSQVAVAVQPTPPPTRCDGVEAQVGNERRCLKAKDGFKDCSDCPEMVVVPLGSFMMGSNDYDGEKPVHKVTIATPFAAAKFDVTFAEWDACVASGGCKHKPEDQGWGRGNRPVINVSWDDATKEYLPWLSRKTGKTYRLLTEAEWEYAARGVTNASAVHTTYSWGNDIGKNQANCDDCGSQWDGKQTAPVGSFKPNAFGLYDMHGNVWQWVQDCWHDKYQGAPTDDSAWETSCTESSGRVLRGGSWYNYPRYLRAASRDRYTTDHRYYGFGFRLARTLNP